MAQAFTQVNTNLTNEDVSMLDTLMAEDGFEIRSAFIRKLIRQEWARRYSQPNVGITIEEAVNAGSGIGS